MPRGSLQGPADFSECFGIRQDRSFFDQYQRRAFFVNLTPQIQHSDSVIRPRSPRKEQVNEPARRHQMGIHLETKSIVEIREKLLTAQRIRWIDADCPTCRQIARERRRHGKQNRARRER